MGDNKGGVGKINEALRSKREMSECLKKTLKLIEELSGWHEERSKNVLRKNQLYIFFVVQFELSVLAFLLQIVWQRTQQRSFCVVHCFTPTEHPCPLICHFISELRPVSFRGM